MWTSIVLVSTLILFGQTFSKIWSLENTLFGFVRKNSNNLNSVGPSFISIESLKTLFSNLSNLRSSNLRVSETVLGSDLLRMALILAKSSL